MRRRILDSSWPYFAAAGALLLAAFFVWKVAPLASRPVGDLEELRALSGRDDVNVVFVLIDTLRADRLGSHGYARPTTPYLDALAATGIRFAHVEAQSSWTKCSMASLWTGLFPTRVGVTRFDHALASELVTPAEIFRDAGFRTAGVWRNGWVSPNFGFGQGFETYLRPSPGPDPARFQRRGPATVPLYGTDEEATRAALAFLDAHGNERFFLYLHYMDLHQYAYDQTSADLEFGTGYSDHYDSALHWVDRNVGLLVGALAQRGLSDRTLVVVGSDHGEGFMEHGHEGHARTLYTEVTRVPLIISLPFRLRRGVAVEPMVRNVDIWPTVLDLLGLPPLPAGDGRSLVPLVEAALAGETAASSAAALPSGPGVGFLDKRWGQPEAEPAPLVSVRQDARSLILARAGDHSARLLFDAEVDPLEQRDLSGQSPPPPWAAQLEQIADQVLAAEPAAGEAPRVKLEELELEQLRALGYVDRPAAAPAPAPGPPQDR